MGDPGDLSTNVYFYVENLGPRKVEGRFPVAHLDIERLLAEWRWLCPGKVRLVARNAHGDLFLSNEEGHVYLLDVAVADLTQIAGSEDQFRELSQKEESREKWFGEAKEREAALRGLVPNADQCIAFSIPLVFKESADTKPYVVDLYECVSFLGDLNHQLRDLPDGAKVQLKFGPKPSS